tara:strand:- start:5867 stop:6133 length:267 start_codon:yes stop_codon:yes gene_type:complete
MGIAVEASPEALADEVMEIMPDNWDSLRAWIACETQWRVVPRLKELVWLGLDFPAVDVVLRRRGCADHVFEDLCTMERAALDVLGGAH